MLPTITAFMAAHRLQDVVIVADAGMISENNMKAIEAAGLSFILGMRIPDVPYVISQWRQRHPGELIPDGHVFVQPWPAGPTDQQHDQVRYYQYKHDRAQRTLKGIDEQVRKAEQAVAGKTAIKRNRFVKLTNTTKTVNPELKPRPVRWPESRATSRISPTPRPSRLSGPTSGCSRSKRASGWPNRTWPPARSSTTSETRSRRT